MPFKDHRKRIAYKKKWNKEYYWKNKQKELQRISKRKEEIAQWYKQYKTTLSCQNCGEKTPICLDFHHKNIDEKEFSLALVKSWGWGKIKIEKEILKCIVLCSNCHRKMHAGLI